MVGVTFGKRTVPVLFHVLPGSCEPILAGATAEELNILVFHGNKDQICEVYSMIEAENETEEGKSYYNEIQHILESYPHM